MIDIIFCSLASFIVGAIIAYFFIKSDLKRAYKEFSEQIKNLQDTHEVEKKDILERSRNTIRGQIGEEFVPLFKDFPYNMSDCKFSSAPIDYVVYNGMSAGRQIEGGELEILFVEVKTNNARLSHTQKQIAEAVKKGRVYFEEWRIKDGELQIKRKNNVN